ncbi:MAG: DMT family transporter [Chitinophagales bacterium]|nr:DMT family transporter [Chitinophagales bacterium]MBP9189397.1 DMT family transporter [Chitinophagales bacterium]MBP9705354.1 DMT family transporter [Chitinophagales bacterium]
MKIIAVYYILLATLLFAIMNVLIKYLTHIPSYEIVFFRSVISFVITLGILMRLKIFPFGRGNRFWLIVRGLAGSAALLLFFYTLQHLPLATAVTIQYLSPIFTILFASILIKEPVHWKQWIFFLLAFAGVFVIKGFDPRVSLPLLGFGVLSAICAAFAYTAVRSVRDNEHALVIIFYLPLSTLPLITPYTIMHWTAPHGLDWLLLFAVGILTQSAQYLMTRAYQIEKVGNVSPFTYTGIIFAIIFGSLIFKETYSLQVILGIALVLTGVLLNFAFVNGYISTKKLKIFVRNFPGF